jgi:hypothetical protein
MALTTDFALEGFRIVRERPVLLVYWTLLSLIKFAGGMLALSVLAGPEWMEWQRIMPEVTERANDATFVAKIEGLMQVVGPACLGIFAVWQLIDGILYAAILRSVNKATPYRFGNLTFGAESWRMGVVSLMVYALLLVIFFGLMFLVVIISTLTAAEPGLVVIAQFVCSLGVVFALIWAFVRLSLSWAASADLKRLGLTESMKITRGLAWPLFGGYALSAILSLVVSYLVQLIFALITLGLKGGALDELASAFNPDFTTPETLLTPDSLIFILASA